MKHKLPIAGTYINVKNNSRYVQQFTIIDIEKGLFKRYLNSELESWSDLDTDAAIDVIEKGIFKLSKADEFNNQLKEIINE